MATTGTAANLTVTITESITLNGVQYGNTVNKAFSSNGVVDQRIMNIATGDTYTDIFNFGTADSAGTGVKNDYAYFRITNLDDTNFVTLQFHNDQGNVTAKKLDFCKTYFYYFLIVLFHFLKFLIFV